MIYTKIVIRAVIILFCLNSALAAELTTAQVDKIADAIKKIENSKKYPYGIKSINVNGDETKARIICENTIKNNYQRWIKAGSKQNYLDFLADVYCPKSCDLQGNINWHKNIHAIVK